MFLLEVSWLQFLIIAGMGIAALYSLFGIYATCAAFRGRPSPPPAPDGPGVSVLKPLKGADPYLYDNLASLCRQHYGTYQIVCGVAEAGDPAISVVHRLQQDHPEIDITLVVDPRLHGTNYKVSNLENMVAHAKHEFLVIADSDIRVPPDHLARLVGSLQDPGVGIVTCLYRAINAGGLPSLVESLFINTDFCAMTLVARKIEPTRYAFGATIAMRRQILEEIGGFLAIANHLADDYQLGNLVAARGHRVVLADHLVDTIITVDSWRTLFRHQLRWARTYRVCRPKGYFGTIVTHSTLWATLNLLYHGATAVSMPASLGLLGLRYAWAALLSWSYLRSDIRPQELALLAPKDLFVSLIWLLAFGGDTVWWSGRRFRVFADGQMTDITPFSPATPAWESGPVANFQEREPTGQP